jgi:hypothetical protein
MVEKLTSKRFNDIWHVVDMMCLDIGEEIPFEEGGVRPEFSLRIQCQWRFIRDDEILLASRDMYEPADPEAPDAWYEDHSDGTVDDATLFVSGLPDFRVIMADSRVSSAGVSPLGDLKISFSNGVYFESFTPCSRKDEFWRAIDFHTRDHLVVFDAP